jgi:hypothetical protein
LQEIGSDCHRRLLVHLQVAVRCTRSTTASAERLRSGAAGTRSGPDVTCDALLCIKPSQNLFRQAVGGRT